MHIAEAQTAGRQGVDVGRSDRAAVATQVAKAGVVDDDE
jgi:hypothetical protein